MPLVDYGSSSEEEDSSSPGKATLRSNDSGQGSSAGAKRVSQMEAKPAVSKRSKASLPPLPLSLTDLFKDRERPPDNPERHQGRVRARAHIDGSWPVHVYLDVKLSSELFDIVTTLTKSARESAPSIVSLLHSGDSQKDPKAIPTEAESAEDATELHISLTRPIYLQELHLGRFTSDVREAFKNRKKFNLSFSGVQSFSNDDRTRSFLSLRVGSGHAEIESLVAEMDIIAERYSQPKFYEDPQFHASFAWAVGGKVLSENTVEVMAGLQSELGHDLRHCSVMVRRVSWKTGQKVGSVALQ